MRTYSRRISIALIRDCNPCTSNALSEVYLERPVSCIDEPHCRFQPALKQKFALATYHRINGYHYTFYEGVIEESSSESRFALGEKIDFAGCCSRNRSIVMAFMFSTQWLTPAFRVLHHGKSIRQNCLEICLSPAQR